MPAAVDTISYASVHDKVVQDRAQFSSSEKHGIVGLMNLGNTCYMNTAVQCLANTPPLVEYFLGFPWRDELNRDNPIGAGGKIADDFGQLIAEMWDVNDIQKKKNKIITPTSFKKTLGCFQHQFQNAQQQDVQELLAFLLDGLHEDLNRVMVKPYVPEVESDGKMEREQEIAVASWRGYLMRNRSIVVDIFQGQLRNVLKCLTCQQQSLKFDPYMYMSVPCNPQMSSLRHCLEEFCKPEVLSSDCQWYCPKCKEPRDAEKKLDLWIAPPIFIVHLKRFQQNAKGKRSKIDSLIDFPLKNLDLSDFVANKSKSRSAQLYNLYGVANHHGSLARGHYTAFARHEHSDQWYKFNDTKIKPISEEEVVTKSAYVLFYSKVCRQETPTDSAAMKDSHELFSQSQDSSSASGIPSPSQPAVKLLTVDMIRRQSITIPQSWPHNVMSTALTPALDIFPEGDEEQDDDWLENLPRPSFDSLSVVGTPIRTETGAISRDSSDQGVSTSNKVEPLKKKRKYVRRNRYMVSSEPALERSARRRVRPERFT
mmetsp:Transcript_6335/g.10367  ORF Transcript_6335/g.10367 Transcript_6335/m.10367 type:complete len:539 (-) Transcript_6335:261-1877(-)|eukprot:CAMPEP_0114472082 /NCGR_PEP_ID=MMETSP0104-20121206/12184_1 /TAXON_ID=37642 ORGANISM="Paraphysomonas imperforata, Strain PA2" /NCGR_SAMPLE_ID=MMETSP0104 /ASSEMBLY_ACC=CAM_ASM_000202 /LENGTH=538 /DNA_ID=CAMNT_0001646027 /DNA_START=44 /DNA_END=1660 /DNA_ORIENTATION=+